MWLIQQGIQLLNLFQKVFSLILWNKNCSRTDLKRTILVQGSWYIDFKYLDNVLLCVPNDLYQISLCLSIVNCVDFLLRKYVQKKSWCTKKSTIKWTSWLIWHFLAGIIAVLVKFRFSQKAKNIHPIFHFLFDIT